MLNPFHVGHSLKRVYYGSVCVGFLQSVPFFRTKIRDPLELDMLKAESEKSY